MVRGAVAALVLARGFDVIKPMLVRAVLVDLRHRIQDQAAERTHPRHSAIPLNQHAAATLDASKVSSLRLQRRRCPQPNDAKVFGAPPEPPAQAGLSF
jgi:hypothetical protein